MILLSGSTFVSRTNSNPKSQFKSPFQNLCCIVFGHTPRNTPPNSPRWGKSLDEEVTDMILL